MAPKFTTEEQNVESFKQLMAPCIPHIITPEIIDQLLYRGFFSAPAAIHHHGSFKGGLFYHSTAVMNMLLVYTEQLELEWGRKESPYIVGMFHDLCKMDDYVPVKNTQVLGEMEWGYNDKRLLTGHGDKSVIMLQQLLQGNVTMQEAVCIRWHMGAFDQKENWNAYGNAVACDQNVLYTHTADMYASRVLDI